MHRSGDCRGIQGIAGGEREGKRKRERVKEREKERVREYWKKRWLWDATYIHSSNIEQPLP
jgi:hypothetical protein